MRDQFPYSRFEEISARDYGSDPSLAGVSLTSIFTHSGLDILAILALQRLAMSGSRSDVSMQALRGRVAQVVRAQVALGLDTGMNKLLTRLADELSGSAAILLADAYTDGSLKPIVAKLSLPDTGGLAPVTINFDNPFNFPELNSATGPVFGMHPNGGFTSHVVR